MPSSTPLPLPDFRPSAPLPCDLTSSQLTTQLTRSSRTILNRLRSIHHDSAFPLEVHKAYQGRLPLIVNKRAGEWYISPEKRQGSVYFKSTDGHTNNWGFSLRRLNLHLLDVIGRNGGEGAIIVDSTRRGKRYPDSLSKTIPIWCAVLNQLLFPSLDQPPKAHTPPQAVSPQENAYITSLIPSFVQAFLTLSIDISKFPHLPKKPLRPFFITPDDFYLPNVDSNDKSTPLIYEDYTPLVLISASRVVRNDGVEGEYIQGAGDDAENWLKSIDLDPTFFWDHHEAILACQSDEEILTLITSIRESPTMQTVESSPQTAYSVSIDKSLCILAKPPNVTKPLKAEDYPLHPSGEPYDIIINVSSLNPSLAVATESDLDDLAAPASIQLLQYLHRGAKPARSLRDTILPQLLSVLSKESSQGSRCKLIAVICDELGDISVAIALFVLCLWYIEPGIQHIPDSLPLDINKSYIRQRLAWITASLGELVTVSRANLNSVNAVLMQRMD